MTAGVRPLHVATIAVVAILATLCAAPRADAFWPFSRERAAIAAADTISAPSLERRFATWKERHAVPDSAFADSVAAALATTPAPVSGIYRSTGLVTTDSSSAANASLPVAAVDSTGNLPPSFAATDSTALASTDSTAAAFAGVAAGTPTPDPNSPAMLAALAAAAARGFAPDLKVKMSSTNDALSLSSDLVSSFADVSGITLSTGLRYAEDISLTQNTEQQTKGLTNSFSLPLRNVGLTLSLSTNNSKLDRLGGRTTTGIRTNNSTEDRGAQFSVSLGRGLEQLPWVGRGVAWRNATRGLRVNTFYSRRFNQNEQDVVAATGSGAGSREHAGEGNSYGAGVGFDRFDKWFSLKARAGRATVDNIDRSPSFINSENLEGKEESKSDGDTASVDLTVPGRWRLRSLSVGFRAARGKDTYSDVSRSIGGGQMGTVGAFRLETKSLFSRSVNVNAVFSPLPRVESTLSLQVSRDSTGYRQRIDQFSDTQRRNWKLDSKLGLWKGGTVQVNYSSSFGDVNLDNPRNPSNALTREDKEKKLYVEVNHALTTTWKVRTYGEIHLAQGFYQHAGPQGIGDSDDLRERVELIIDGAVGPKIMAHVSMLARRYDQAFLDPRRSASSQNETEYVIRPGYTYQLTPRVTLAQSYGLNSKVIDKVFKASESTLNRNHFMTTRLDFKLTRVVSLSADYDYLLQDSGLYRARPGSPQRFFAPQARTKKDGIGMGISFAVLPKGKLSFVSRQQSTRERRTNFGGNNSQTITERGNLALGLDSSLKIGELSLNAHLRRNQSFNVTLNRNVFYNVDATLSYVF